MKKWLMIPMAILFTLFLLLGGCAPKEYPLTISVNGEGSVTPSAGEYNYKDGESATLKAVPDAGWKFDGWTGDASGSNLTVSVVMDKEKGVTANFSKMTYSLTVSINGEGSVNPKAGTYTYDAGETVDVTAIPITGWKFDSWSGDISTPTEDTLSLTMDSNKTVVATFVKITRSLTIEATGSGTVDPPAGSYSKDDGAVINVTATPASGWLFNGWNGDVAISTSATTTVTMNSDKTVTANFTKSSFDLTITLNGSGTIEPRTGTYTYDRNAVITLKATPSAGWKFDNWTGDVASPNSANTTITMNSDKTIVANFSKSSYSLFVSVNGMGYSYPSSGQYTYNAGEVLKVSATPATGWRFDHWGGDVASPTSASTTLTINSDKTLVANFIEAQKDYGPLAIYITTGSGDFNISSLHTGDKVDFNFTVSGTGVGFSILDPDGIAILDQTGESVFQGEDSFTSTVSGDYKLHFTTSAPLAQSTVSVRYTVYYAP